MRRRPRTGLAVLVALTLSGCGHPELLPGGRPVPTEGPRTVPFDLYTHCGIHELTFEGRWYERTGGSQDDGQMNPPEGWGNPYHPGTLTASGSTVVFTDDLGHRETFRLREGATAPKTVCS